MFRIAYLVVLVGGLFWILQTRPVWLDPQRAADMRPASLNEGEAWQANEDARMDETTRRIKLVAAATIAVVVAGELWILVVHRLRLFHRT